MDQNNANIQVFDPHGNFITKWGSYGNQTGQFDEPHGIVIDSKGFVYVADTQNARIQKFTSDGEFVKIIGKNGVGEGEFLLVHDISIDPDDYLYVLDSRDAHKFKKSVIPFLTKIR